MSYHDINRPAQGASILPQAALHACHMHKIPELHRYRRNKATAVQSYGKHHAHTSVSSHVACMCPNQQHNTLRKATPKILRYIARRLLTRPDNSTLFRQHTVSNLARQQQQKEGGPGPHKATASHAGVKPQLCWQLRAAYP